MNKDILKEIENVSNLYPRFYFSMILDIAAKIVKYDEYNASVHDRALLKGLIIMQKDKEAVSNIVKTL